MVVADGLAALRRTTRGARLVWLQVVTRGLVPLEPRVGPTQARHHDRPDDIHIKEPSMAETYSGEFYCVKCKEKRQAEGQVVETNGRRMAKGKCPVCGTNLNRILGKA